MARPPAEPAASDGVPAPAKPPTIWRFVDDRPGHLSQSHGLCQAIRRLREHRIVDVPSAGLRVFPHQLLCGPLPPILATLAPRPDLIIGAGHRTHLPMLATRRALGGRVIVLMRPSLPMAWFDCCILPEHDLPRRPRPNVIASRGALNAITATTRHDPARGLILVGGPSKHYAWNEPELCQMLTRILQRDPQTHWMVGDSRRTPATTSARLATLASNNPCQFFPHAETDQNWVAEALRQAGQAWISEDSISTMYEALSSGAPTGLLPVPTRGENKLHRQTTRMLRDGMLCDFATWATGAPLRALAHPLQEATRCVGILRDRGWV